jgi:hypothetical protein
VIVDRKVTSFLPLGSLRLRHGSESPAP